MSRYDDIIGHRYEGSTTHERMSLENRAAQFAPFAALTGHDAAINETARLTSEKIELTADEQRRLSEQMSIVLGRLDKEPLLTFTIFRKDSLKPGGHYETVSGIIKKYDEYGKTILLTGNIRIKIEDIISIEELS